MRLFTALFLVFTLTAQAQTSKPAFGLEDVFGLNYVSSPQVSPDGDFVVYSHNFMDIMEDRRRSNLWRIDSDGKNARPLTTGAVNDGNARISPDSQRMAYVSQDDTGAQIFVRWLNGGENQQLTRLSQSPSSLSWSPDGKWLAFTMLVPDKPESMGSVPASPKGANWADPPIVINRAVYRADGRGSLVPGFNHVFIISTAGGVPRQLTSGDYNHSGSIAWSANSETVYFSGNRSKNWEVEVQNSDIFSMPAAGGVITALTNKDGPDYSVSVSPDGKRMAWRGYTDKRFSYQQQHVYVMDINGGEPVDLLPSLDRSISDYQWAADSRGLYIQYDDHAKTKLAYVTLNGKLKDITNQLGGLAISRPYSGGQFSVGGNNTFAITEGDFYSPAELAIGRGTDAPTRVTALNNNLLAHRQLAAMEEISVKSSVDGRDIEAWIALPPNFDPAQKYPLLLEIHGGPHTAYGPHFAAEIQLFASAGYVTVYANPRGSTSYGADFALTIHHNYPSEDYDDLMDVVDSVASRAYIDQEQLYVTGGSGGGTLTAWIVGKTDRFRAAVVAKPVINWLSFVLSADSSPYFSQYWFPAMPWEDPMDHWQRSPLSLVGQVKTPTMLLVGDEDLRTPSWESEQYYQALKLRGIDTALVRIPGASHSIANRPSQLIAKVAAILEWFERHSGKETTDQGL
ncbi:MAG: S9 family peptidase [Halioglobus sp.]